MSSYLTRNDLFVINDDLTEKNEKLKAENSDLKKRWKEFNDLNIENLHKLNELEKQKDRLVDDALIMQELYQQSHDDIRKRVKDLDKLENIIIELNKSHEKKNDFIDDLTTTIKTLTKLLGEKNG